MSDFCEVCECDPCDCHGAERGDQKMKHEYIYDEDRKFYYVPRAPSVCEARVRSLIFMKHFGDEPLICNPQVWDMLKAKHKVRYLEE
jgi:hypothetical protein